MELDDEILQVADVEVGNEDLIVKLKDGRTVTTPLWWYPRLSNAKPAMREKWRIMPFGDAIEWDELDEHISVKGMLRGH
ncbi:MAG: DUF2442 domain-containing protein, partial [Rhodospirillales bacterium]|nr:DUF2442 domain-containing protein [Rhodospirillales bacterium]